MHLRRKTNFRARERKEMIDANKSLFLFKKKKISSLNQRELVGGNVEGIDIGGQAGVGLLGAVRAKKQLVHMKSSLWL